MKSHNQTRRVLVHGAAGRMGQCVREALKRRDDLRIGALVETPDHPQIGSNLEEGAVLTSDVDRATNECDVAVSFALPEGSLHLLRACAHRGIASIVGTTGFQTGQHAEIESLAENIPIVLAANFSISVNIMLHLVRTAAGLLGEDYDAEILELHHREKIDAPSGTALSLGKAVAEGRKQIFEDHSVMTREGAVGTRLPNSIGLQALRGGDVAGEHNVMFLGVGERLEIVHRASTREHFARGALHAASWIRGREPGLYNMEQVLGLTSQ